MPRQAALTSMLVTTCDLPVPGGPVTTVCVIVSPARTAARCSVFIGRTSISGSESGTPATAAGIPAVIHRPSTVPFSFSSATSVRLFSSVSSPCVYGERSPGMMTAQL